MVLASLLLAAGCGKSGPAASGALSEGEKGLFAYLPADADVVFGGSYKDFAGYWENSPLKDLAAKGAGLGGDVQDWTECWSKFEDLTFAGTVSLGTQRMRMLARGLTADIIETCTKKLPGVEVTREDGGKYLVVKGLGGGAQEMGYYFIDDKTAYFSASLTGGGGTAPLADLKADLAAAKTKSVLDNEKLQALAKTANRSSMMWFCGNAAGTPAAAQVKEGCISIGVTKSSLTMDFSVDLATAETAEMAVAQFKAMASQLDKMPAQMAAVKDALSSILDKAKLDNDGALLTGHFELENSAIGPLVGMASMFGALMQ
ncbi:MAG: hypothetical protein ACI9MR_001242 [Myxococcota bacterium]|jgi:hypothetical protein